RQAPAPGRANESISYDEFDPGYSLNASSEAAVSVSRHDLEELGVLPSTWTRSVPTEVACLLLSAPSGYGRRAGPTPWDRISARPEPRRRPEADRTLSSFVAKEYHACLARAPCATAVALSLPWFPHSLSLDILPRSY